MTILARHDVEARGSAERRIATGFSFNTNLSLAGFAFPFPVCTGVVAILALAVRFERDDLTTPHTVLQLGFLLLCIFRCSG